MLTFMAALYNEENQIESLLNHVNPYVDAYAFVDDGSTDNTWKEVFRHCDKIPSFETIEHTGLPETVKARALEYVHPDSWVIMLDADERFGDGVLPKITNFINSKNSEGITHVWFTLQEFIDGQHTRTFQKCRLFRASAANFSTRVHEDDTFTGNGAFFGWTVLHNKSKEKQVQREKEYLETYQRLVSEGKITQERADEMKSFHYFVR